MCRVFQRKRRRRQYKKRKKNVEPESVVRPSKPKPVIPWTSSKETYDHVCETLVSGVPED
jgi:hypothetical protein